MTPVDSYRWLPRSLAAFYRDMDLPREDPIPFAPLSKPLDECRLTAITTGGVHLRNDIPFDVAREQGEPTWGDPTFRILPDSVTADDVSISHLHYDPDDARADLDVVFPVPLLRDFVEDGLVQAITPRHYSFMGFQLDATELLDVHLPDVVALLHEDRSDAVVLTPA